MRRLRDWLLPAAPDLLGGLTAQATATAAGMAAFAAWAAGDPGQAARVRACSAIADARKREVLAGLRSVLVAPLDPEDLFALAQGLDRVLDRARDTVGESEVIAAPPDAGLAAMAVSLSTAAEALARAVAGLGAGAADPSEAAEEAIARVRELEHVYRRVMGELLDSDDAQHATAYRELYRRCTVVGDALADVAERVAYAVIKER